MDVDFYVLGLDDAFVMNIAFHLHLVEDVLEILAHVNHLLMLLLDFLGSD